ncbi:hypothetical protein [Frigidibacter sp. ROC022]|uniref:hypothetical protein n=1 Tax=Frigidibacter sp. ROC022 TaxID=2971796 RepID=UPI00215B10D3|nr:hypothetical protein [Frigidibacter sp. ROC022]MCR8724709.1 hypothetical protein [Frigidibacter sp. ROC022]
MTTPERPSGLTPDCDSCAALCCIILAFDKGEAFAIDKPAGLPCPHLDGHACSIHASLTDAGFPGCARYDCFGAGQIVTRDIFAGASWQDQPDLAMPMAEAFRLLREVQDMRAQLQIALDRFAPDEALRARIEALDRQLAPEWSAETLAAFDPAAARAAFQDILSALRNAKGAPA